jgi:CheY-like chemotaxis protein
MAHSLRLTVLAEGVETDGQLAFLRSHNCDQMQGYLFSKPLPMDELAQLLRDQRSLPPLPRVDGGGTILLLDDEPSVLAALRRLLRGEGYRIFTAETSSAAFEVLAQHRVQVIVSDQRMPTMTGTEFFGRVKDLYPDTIRIMLSGYSELKSVTEAINQGAVYKFLSKPWNDEELRVVIKEAFQRFAGQSQGLA